ncbi:ATP synthase epsilon chain [hydrothermal vent metagenome]|uniref:ATP synthase epsilon chain n=1 Tax=hydrothermal vent metagenome TaxID=652676 RepID=A0A1W1C6V8_9ZZZZ
MKLMKLEIVTPKGTIYDGDAKQVTLPGSEGEFGVLPEHATLVSILSTGIITIELPNGDITDVAINSGYVKVDESKVICIVEGAVALKSDDSDIAKKIEEATELLKSAQPSSVAIASAVSRVEQMGKSI